MHKANIQMTNKILNVIGFFIAVFLLGACNSTTTNEKVKEEMTAPTITYQHGHVMTKAEQDSLKPEQVLQEFIAGNERFKKGNVTQLEHSEELEKQQQVGNFQKQWF